MSSAPTSDTTDQKDRRRKLLVGLGILAVGGGAAAVALTGGSGAEDFTAVDARAQAAQQVCFDVGLFYDAFGNCYDVDPASIVEADRPGFVVAPGDAVVAAPAPEDGAGDDAATSGAAGGSTGQPAPSAGGATGQQDPSTGGTAQQPAPPADSDAQPDPSGDATTEAAPSATPSTAPTPDESPTADPAPSPTASPTTAPSPTPSAAPILALTRNEWRFVFTPDPPAEDCSIDDDDVNVNLSPACQTYDRAYDQQSSFICDIAAGGAVSCTQDDQNRDMTVTGTVSRSSISLVRQVPGQTRTSVSRLSGSNVRDGDTPGEVCFMSGRQSETVFDQNGDTETVAGSWSATRNAPGC